jgi:SAM-dependent methyltransferase
MRSEPGPVRAGISIRGRHRIAAQMLAAESGRVLDVGARDAVLRGLLDGARLQYESADVAPGPHAHRVDLEGPLPFADRAYDWVVALDVLEHVDRIHVAISEILRIAGRGCVLSLPNLASWPHRLRFLRSGRLSTEKYELPTEPPADRHRWLVHLRDADRFVGAAAAREGFAIEARVLECEGRGRAGRLAAWSLLESRLPLASALAARSVYRLVRRIPRRADDVEVART